MSFTKDSMEVSLVDSGKGKKSKQTCFKFDLPKNYFSEDHDTFIFMSAFTGNIDGYYLPNEHVIHEVRFVDKKHLHDSEEIDSSGDRRPFAGKY